jgi:hypothetical protein
MGLKPSVRIGCERANTPTIKSKILHWVAPSAHKQKDWRRGASIPLPLACEASALPFELRPPSHLLDLAVMGCSCLHKTVYSCVWSFYVGTAGGQAALQAFPLLIGLHATLEGCL